MYRPYTTALWPFPQSVFCPVCFTLWDINRPDILYLERSMQQNIGPSSFCSFPCISIQINSSYFRMSLRQQFRLFPLKHQILKVCDPPPRPKKRKKEQQQKNPALYNLVFRFRSACKKWIPLTTLDHAWYSLQTLIVILLHHLISKHQFLNLDAKCSEWKLCRRQIMFRHCLHPTELPFFSCVNKALVQMQNWRRK